MARRRGVAAAVAATAASAAAATPAASGGPERRTPSHRPVIHPSIYRLPSSSASYLSSVCQSESCLCVCPVLWCF
uniref:Predicted protein n=1 Tax=Hordeum vulgare subsp. vulgare TaxID=112509 RepID=F2DXU8_HORVV|nr:predicted protein [Hordeum vulgare subsp. vulgare]